MPPSAKRKMRSAFPAEPIRRLFVEAVHKEAVYGENKKGEEEEELHDIAAKKNFSTLLKRPGTQKSKTHGLEPDTVMDANDEHADDNENM